MATSHPRRRGITLIELLVVISIMGTLAGIVAVFAPRMLEQSRVPEGARQLQSWLQIARQRAIRDQAPRGIRLVSGPAANTTNQALYSKFVYIEQPDDLTGMIHAPSGGVPPDAFLLDRDLSTTVKAGDIIEAGFARYYITACLPNADPTPPSPKSYVQLNRVPDSVTFPSSYRITRGMQQIMGEPEMDLPADVAVDVLYTSGTQPETRSLPALPASAGSGNFDIVFNRTGEVVGNLGTVGRVALWVRDVTLGEPTNRWDIPQGDNRLIVIHTRTGQVTAHPVCQDVGSDGKPDAYKFVRDGKSSAME